MQHLATMVMLSAVGLSAGLMGCAAWAQSIGAIEKIPFGAAPDGTPVELYTLRNSKGMEARIMTYGGIVISLKTPDKNGKLGDVVLGYDHLDGYLKSSPFFGAIIGRCGNRIARGKFTLNGRVYTLAINNPPNHLHGGVKAFDKVVWQATSQMTPKGPSLRLGYLSKDGEEGYPGNLSVTAIYTVTEGNELRVEFTATTDQDTVCNLTQHSYFNLRGGGEILDDLFQINADKFTPTDGALIPTGELRPVTGTLFDLRQPAAIRARIDQPDDQLKIAGGYDQNFIINKPPGQLGLCARVSDPASGRVLEVWSTAPGVQFYTANFLDGSITGKDGWTYQKRQAFCLEPQNYPDSPNHPDFPSVVLHPGQIYKHTILYRFSN
jgi:aldose 1-epimerase